MEQGKLMIRVLVPSNLFPKSRLYIQDSQTSAREAEALDSEPKAGGAASPKPGRPWKGLVRRPQPLSPKSSDQSPEAGPPTEASQPRA